jgi:isoaspartyl peptidase/L-asparaginase-like protein (Ntn-hydrolase superfamily)
MSGSIVIIHGVPQVVNPVVGTRTVMHHADRCIAHLEENIREAFKRAKSEKDMGYDREASQLYEEAEQLKRELSDRKAVRYAHNPRQRIQI